VPWDLSDIAVCGWCVDGLTFSPLFLYSISIRFLLLITNRSQLTGNLKIKASKKNWSSTYSLGKARSERHYLIVGSSSIKQPRTMTSKSSRSVLSMKDYKQFLQKLQVLRSLIQRQVTYIKRIDFFLDLYGLKEVGIEVWEEI